MNTLYFEKISKYDRPSEPVMVSIPFQSGKLHDPEEFTILDGDSSLPIQTRVLATWPDGSIKWMIVHYQPDLPGNQDKTMKFELRPQRKQPEPKSVVVLNDSDDGIRIDTGPLNFLIPRDGFMPITDVSLNQNTILGGCPFNGFSLRHDGKNSVTSTGKVELTIEEEGPLCVVVLVRGKHRRPDGKGYIDLRGRITAYAGKPYVGVEHGFIHAEEEPHLMFEELRLDFEPEVSGTPRVSLGEGYYNTRIREGEGPLDMMIDGETILNQSFEHYIDSFYGDFWADWRDEDAGLALSIHQAHQNFPKKLFVDSGGTVCSLYPAEPPPVKVYQGMAKTHRILLNFHGPDTSLEEISTRSLQFQIPDRPALSRQWFRENNPWELDFFPADIPARLITYLNRLHDGRPKALGMLHFGDAPDSAYTDQGRGGGRVVWVNNEYDRPHACALYYALTGQRRVLDSSLVSARHWLDVDLCHHSPDPLQDGGLKVHSADHVTAGISISHEWVDGFLDYYYLTGRQEGLDAAYSVANNIMRKLDTPRMKQEGSTSTRENGWALRAMVAMFLATGEPRYKTESERIAKLLVRWHRKFGGLLAPYTQHSMPRVVFMNAITANSLTRYLLIEDDEKVKQLVVDTADDLIEHCMGPDGIFFYKELPSLRRLHLSPHVLELLTHAYRISGEEKYMRIATRQFAAIFEGVPKMASGEKCIDESGAVLQGQGGGRHFAYTYTPLLVYVDRASRLGLLDWYEYPM